VVLVQEHEPPSMRFREKVKRLHPVGTSLGGKKMGQAGREKKKVTEKFKTWGTAGRPDCTKGKKDASKL